MIFITLNALSSMFEYPQHYIAYFFADIAWWIGLISSYIFSRKFRNMDSILRNGTFLIFCLIVGIIGSIFLEIWAWSDIKQIFPPFFFATPILTFILVGLIAKKFG